MPFPNTNPAIEVDAANQPSLPYYMGQVNPGLSLAARNQPAFGPWAIGSRWYLLLSNVNNDFHAILYASADQGASWTQVDQANAPVLLAGRAFMAPVLHGSAIYVAYFRGSSPTIPADSTGLVVQKFDPALGALGQWSTITPPLFGTSGVTFARDIQTWDLIVKADGDYTLLTSQPNATGTAYSTSYQRYSAGAWGGSFVLDLSFTDPVITGFVFDSPAQLGYVFYTQNLAFASVWPAPNPLNVVTIDGNGNVGTPQVVTPDLQSAQPSPNIFTYPAVDSLVTLPNGTLLATFAAAQGQTGVWGPAYFVKPLAGGWSGPFSLSAAADDLFTVGVATQTVTFLLGATAYLFWLTRNSNGGPLQDQPVDQWRFVTTDDGVTFSPVQLAYDMNANPPANFLPQASGGGGFMPLVSFDAAAQRFLFAFGYTDSVTSQAVTGFFSVALAAAAIGKGEVNIFPILLPDPQLACCALRAQLRCKIYNRGGVRAIVQTLKAPIYARRR